MTTTPDPKTVREIARDCVADYIDDARDIAAHVMGHFGMDVPGDVYAWTDAVRTDLRAVVPSWPDEQPQDERDARIAQLERELRNLRGTELNPSPLVLDAQAYNKLRDEIAATMGDEWDLDEAEISILIKYVRWLSAGQPRDEDGYPIRRKAPEGLGDASGASRCRNLEITTLPQDDGDVRAVAALLAACGNEVGAANDAVARAMDAVEARFADRIAALDARDAKAGEHR